LSDKFAAVSLKLGDQFWVQLM